MEAEQSAAIINWAGANFKTALFINYEQVRIEGEGSTVFAITYSSRYLEVVNLLLYGGWFLEKYFNKEFWVFQGQGVCYIKWTVWQQYFLMILLPFNLLRMPIKHKAVFANFTVYFPFSYNIHWSRSELLIEVKNICWSIFF